MNLYHLATQLASPLLPLWLYWRSTQGKEDRSRIKERFGYASRPRPDIGTLLWLHAASVGEANSVLNLVNILLSRLPNLHIMVTTGTVTSAKLMESRLPERAFHQYVPVDTPKATERFMAHWHPDVACWIESEFWPNLIMAADEMQCFMGIINGRMSQKSFKGWQKRPEMIADLLKRFNLIFAQSEKDKERLEALGALQVLSLGNLKFDAQTLPCDEEALLLLSREIGDRPMWLAASTHPGEEALIAQTHQLMAMKHPDLLTIVVPRHPNRGAEVAAALQASGAVTQRSKKQAITKDTKFYVADTLGELGLFYRMCDIVFMGGSLVEHGGQNPLEPARLSCALITGPHTHNFSDITAEMQSLNLLLRVDNAADLAATVDQLFQNNEHRSQMQQQVKKWVDEKSGAISRMLVYLEPLLKPYTLQV